MKKKEFRNIKEEYRSEEKSDFLINKNEIDENIKINDNKPRI